MTEEEGLEWYHMSVEEYRKCIEEAISRIIELHGTKDPYYQKIIQLLIEDLRDYEAELQWYEGRDYFEAFWRRLMRDFFGDTPF